MAKIAIPALTIAAALGGAPANAAAHPPASDCFIENLCMWWDNSFQLNSARTSEYGVLQDHLAYTFPYNGRGGGTRLGNNAASFWNSKQYRGVTIYYNPSRNWVRPSGPSQWYAPFQARNCTEAGPYICNNNRASFPDGY